MAGDVFFDGFAEDVVDAAATAGGFGEEPFTQPGVDVEFNVHG